MVEKSKLFYFTVFILVVVAFIFHINAMGHHHWKKAIRTNFTGIYPNHTTIGLFTRCIPSQFDKTETCYPNMYPGNASCPWDHCIQRSLSETCRCDYSPSTKGIAACTIIAAVCLGLAIIILFLHSVKTTETRAIELVLSLFPLLLLLLAFIFILIALILVGSYLSRDIMYMFRPTYGNDWAALRDEAKRRYEIRVDWSTGLEIIALFFTFLSFVLYSVFVFIIGRSS